MKDRGMTSWKWTLASVFVLGGIVLSGCYEPASPTGSSSSRPAARSTITTEAREHGSLPEMDLPGRSRSEMPDKLDRLGSQSTPGELGLISHGPRDKPE